MDLYSLRQNSVVRLECEKSKKKKYPELNRVVMQNINFCWSLSQLRTFGCCTDTHTHTHTSRSFTSKDLIRCSASVYGAVSRLPTLLFPVHIYLSAIPTSRSEHQHTINRNKRTRNMSYMYTLFIFVHLVGRCWLHVCMSELVHVYTVRR